VFKQKSGQDASFYPFHNRWTVDLVLSAFINENYECALRVIRADVKAPQTSLRAPTPWRKERKSIRERHDGRSTTREGSPLPFEVRNFEKKSTHVHKRIQRIEATAFPCWAVRTQPDFLFNIRCVREQIPNDCVGKTGETRVKLLLSTQRATGVDSLLRYDLSFHRSLGELCHYCRL
jgi:hypothetical protein